MRASNHMEHMRIPWEARRNRGGGRWIIYALGWAVAEIPFYLPGDAAGRLTAKAICEAHNKMLEQSSVGAR